MQHAWERLEMHTVFELENLNGRDHLVELGVDGSIILEWILGKQVWKVLSGLIWLRIGTSSGSL
jgi:hypothetical protein